MNNQKAHKDKRKINNTEWLDKLINKLIQK